MKPSIIEDYQAIYNNAEAQDVLSLITSIKKGIEFAYFTIIAGQSPFSLTEWSAFLHLSERTMQRYKKEKKTFDTLQSERILSISMLYKYGVNVFGNKEMFNTWLTTSNIALANKKPQDFLDTSMGIQLIRDELTRLEHGVLA